MRSVTTPRFRREFGALPAEVQERVRRAHALFLRDLAHPSLRFKQVHPTRSIHSARVGLGYRALALREGDAWVWFWVGTHADYDRLLRDR